jgi:hypothetical protein
LTSYDSRNRVGRAGEFFAAYVLEYYFGVTVHHVDVAQDDLWVRLPDNRICTVQVKTATETKHHSNYKSYAFSLGTSGADFYCFVAVDRQLALFSLPPEKSAVKKRIRPRVFTHAGMITSVEHCLNITALPPAKT